MTKIKAWHRISILVWIHLHMVDVIAQFAWKFWRKFLCWCNMKTGALWFLKDMLLTNRPVPTDYNTETYLSHIRPILLHLDNFLVQTTNNQYTQSQKGVVFVSKDQNCQNLTLCQRWRSFDRQNVSRTNCDTGKIYVNHWSWRCV